MKTHGYPHWEAVTKANLAILVARRGEFRAARTLIAEAQVLREDLGLVRGGAWERAIVDLLARDLAAAERTMRSEYAWEEETGDKAGAATAAAKLAHILWGQGRDEEALGFTVISENTAASAYYEAQVLWRSARGAKVLARRSRFDEAESLAREAVERARRTDELDKCGDTLMDLAEVLLLRGSDEAIPVIEEALQLYEQKGNLVMAERTRTRLAELTPQPAA